MTFYQRVCYILTRKKQKLTEEKKRSITATTTNLGNRLNGKMVLYLG